MYVYTRLFPTYDQYMYQFLVQIKSWLQKVYLSQWTKFRVFSMCSCDEHTDQTHVCSLTLLFLSHTLSLFHESHTVMYKNSSWHSGDDRLRNKSVRAHEWVWIRKSGESLWTHNAPPEPAVREITVEYNMCYLLLTWIFWYSIFRGPWWKIRKLKSVISRSPWWKIRKVSQQKVPLISLASVFPYCRLGRGVVGSEGFFPISEPTLTCGLGRICVYVDRPHCDSNLDMETQVSEHTHTHSQRMH